MAVAHWVWLVMIHADDVSIDHIHNFCLIIPPILK